MAALARSDARHADQRRHRRWPLSFAGRFVFDDAIEHRCRSIDISPGGAALLTATRGSVGQRVVCYLDGLGRIEGHVTRLFEGGFALSFTASPAKREKLAQQLALQADRPPAPARPASPPEAPAGPPSRAMLRLPDGRVARVQVMDLSSVGATLICPVPVSIGAPVTMDGRPARVARCTQALVALLFDGPGGGAPDGASGSGRPWYP